MKRIILSFIFLGIFSAESSAQKLQLDRVTKAELAEKRNPNDTSAVAAFLFKKARTRFEYKQKDGFVSYTVVDIKLKVYKKEGLEWANFKIPYYVGYEKLNDETIQITDAASYNLENDKIVKTKLSGEGIFSEKINENWKAKSLTFPNVKEGSIVEFSYELKTENISSLPDFQFQYRIPVNNMEYLTEIPELYIYKAIQKGYVEVSKEEKLESTAQSFYDEYNQTKQLTYMQIKTKYHAKNIPALKEESYVNNINNYFGMLEHELQTIRMPDEKPKQIATTWEAVAKSIYDDTDFNTAVTKHTYFLNDIKSTIQGATTNEERTKKIFSFIRSKMNWNGKYGYYPKKKMEMVYTEKVGNVAEINLMLVSMLRVSGIDAHPVLISTRENGFANFPNRSLFNYVIAAADVNGKTVLMDATDKLSDLDMLPIRALNWQGRLIKSDGTTSEIDLMPKTNSRDMINIMAAITPQGEVSGKIREQYFDYSAFVFRSKYNGVAKDSYIENLEKRSHGLEIGDYNVQNSIDLNLPIVENYEFKSTNSVEIIGNKIYVSPFLFLAKTENPFKQETRDYPVDFVFPNQNKLNVSLTIPDGYAVETLPESKSVAMPLNLGSFKYNISTNGNQIQMLYTQDINQAVIESEYYSALKNFFKEIVAKQTEKIVLKKV